jgi:hypothetical protein
MNILDADIERYTSYLEFTLDGLYRCHPKDEPRFKELKQGYEKILEALENFKQLEAA